MVLTLNSSESVADPIEPAVAVRLADAAVMSTSGSPSVIEFPAKSVAIPVVELAMIDPATMSLVAPLAVKLTFPAVAETLVAVSVPLAVKLTFPAVAETLVAVSVPAAVTNTFPDVDETLESVTALLLVR